MSILICPVCKLSLQKSENRYFCQNNHSFDISKKGYVNLLMSNSSKERRHGDDKSMIEARRDFLNRGFYKPLAEKIANVAKLCSIKEPDVFECGCGECYYLEAVSNELSKDGILPALYGMDISKDALPYGKKRFENITLFASSAYSIPLKSESVDIGLSIFAPMCAEEMARIIKKDGLLIKVIPLENHLIELKETLYENVYLNRPVIEEIKGFHIKSFEKIEYVMELTSQEEINSLFRMTPYYYKTSEQAQKKLSEYDTLSVKAEFGIITYIKL